MVKKTLIILVGPKGAGKTSIGLMAERQLGIKFLNVELLWLSLPGGEDGWQKVENEVDKLLLEHNKVIIESLGAGEGFEKMYASFQKKHIVKLVRVWSDLPLCLERVKTRDSSHHLAIPLEKVAEYNHIAAQVNYDWDAVINNNEFVDANEAAKVISKL